jgi:RHS repeat-associated protein
MDAAGNVIPKSTIGNNILFQGREYEPETNFYYFRARHYDPIMGRFLQVDPMGYQDSLNLYQAFNMNPVNFVDPFGQSAVCPGVFGCSYGESKLYHENYEFRRFVDGYYRGMGETIFNPLTLATIGLTIINPTAGIAFGLGALTNTYYHSVKDRLEEGQSFGGALGGGVLDLTGVSDIQASGKVKDPYKSGELVASGSIKLGTTAIAIVYGAKMGLSKLRIASEAPTGGSTVKYNAKAGRFYDAKTGRFIKFKEVMSTEADKAFFWSGRTKGVGGEKVAANIAEEYKGMTLEKLVEQRGIKMPEWNPNDPNSIRAWENLSKEYAKNASGTVRAVVGESTRPGSVWEIIELPELMKNPKVNRIIKIDPATGKETVIFVR